jgi:integrase/recombinase XerD
MHAHSIKLAVDAFLIACEADGLSRASIKWYRSCLRAFEVYHPGFTVQEITASNIREYIVALRNREAYKDAKQRPATGKSLSVASINSHVTALHAFWSWTAKEFSIANPMQNVRRPKPQQPEPKAVDSRDFVKLFNATGNDLLGIRDRALLTFLADTGVRLGGVTSLTLENLDLDNRRAVVVEKGNKRRVLVFTSMTARFLREWLYRRSSRSANVFTSLALGSEHAGLKPSGVSQLLRRLKKQAGVRGRCNPHSFRHAFAREYLRAGGDIATLARLLGHSNINTTASYYAVFSQDELADLHEKYSPLKEMMK